MDSLEVQFFFKKKRTKYKALELMSAKCLRSVLNLRHIAYSFCLLATIGEPEVKCMASTQSIKFFIHPPYTPLKDEDNQTLTVVDIFSQFGDVTYEITMFCQKTQQKVRRFGRKARRSDR